ncbi:MAG: bifunctional riboflavin kinase/FAD synthetase [Nitrospira sp.]|nr:bifunctional riboflavin kinase/FAD synthetase [Nitrospira sp.]
MKITRGLDEHQRAPYPVLTIGNFDGQHRGHQALLQSVVRTAAEAGGTPMVLTFDPHPITVLRPGIDLLLLTPLEEKLARFQEAGIKEVLFLTFNAALATLTPEEFVCQVLGEGIGVKELFVGQHFAFGKGRAGHMDDLLRLSAKTGFRVHAVPPVLVDGEVVSSTRVRQLVQAGELRAAARCLGRPYGFNGTVVTGAQRGATLGWPTANLRLPQRLALPPDGVYATITHWKTNRLASASYIGTRPTFDAGERLLEVHLLDQQVQLYGQEIRVEFIERIRGDLHFKSAQELSARIELDVRLAREALANQPPTLAEA